MSGLPPGANCFPPPASYGPPRPRGAPPSLLDMNIKPGPSGENFYHPEAQPMYNQEPPNYGEPPPAAGPPPMPPPPMRFAPRFMPRGPPPRFMPQRGMMRPMFRGGGGMRPRGPFMPPPNFNPSDVLMWLDHQHPYVIKRVLFHCKWLLKQFGEEEDEDEDEESGTEGATGDTSDWYAPDAAKAANGGDEKTEGEPPAKVKKPTGLGWQRQVMQWTPSGWVVKDNSHKVTTMMRPLPEPEPIPPQSTTYPEAAADKDKLKMLENNENMMSFELTKICRRFKISALDKDDLTAYPEDQQNRLRTAINCVAAAEKTLKEFKDFLVQEKYKEWNDEQRKSYEEKIKQMIGDTPQGAPHKRTVPVSAETETETATETATEEGEVAEETKEA